MILLNFSFNWKECCRNCNHFFQSYNVKRCTCKYWTALSSNLYPRSLSFVRCILTGPLQPEYLLKMDFTTVFPGILKPAAYRRKDSTTDVYILKPKANYLSIKGRHHWCLYSKACNLALNGTSRILWTGTITQILFPVMQHNTLVINSSSSMLAIYSNNLLYKILSEQ